MQILFNPYSSYAQAVETNSQPIPRLTLEALKNLKAIGIENKILLKELIDRVMLKGDEGEGDYEPADIEYGKIWEEFHHTISQPDQEHLRLAGFEAVSQFATSSKAKENILLLMHVFEAEIEHLNKSPEEMTKLGRKFEKRNGVLKQKAAIWFEKAAKLGDENAMWALASMLSEGDGVNKDKTQAAIWFEKAAELGDETMMYNLALMLSEGDGVDQNKTRAAMWFEKAAVLKHRDGMWKLASMLLQGEGVEKYIIKGEMLLEQGAKLGDEKAKNCLAFRRQQQYEQTTQEETRIAWKTVETVPTKGLSKLTQEELDKTIAACQKALNDKSKDYSRILYAEVTLMELKEEAARRWRWPKLCWG